MSISLHGYLYVYLYLTSTAATVAALSAYEGDAIRIASAL